MNRFDQWFERIGSRLTLIGGACMAGAEAVPSQEIAPWMKFAGVVLIALGGGSSASAMVRRKLNPPGE